MSHGGTPQRPFLSAVSGGMALLFEAMITGQSPMHRSSLPCSHFANKLGPCGLQDTTEDPGNVGSHMIWSDRVWESVGNFAGALERFLPGYSK